MKASDFNKKPTEQRTPKQNNFSGEHFAKAIKYLVILIIFSLSISSVKWFIDRQPVKLTQEQVDSAVVRLIKPDTVLVANPDTLTIPVEYQYVDSHFKSNGDTTYWFLTGNLRGPNDFYQGVSRVIKLPYSAFNFAEAAKLMRKGTKEANDSFIESFTQISKATYISYRKYADEN